MTRLACRAALLLLPSAWAVLAAAPLPLPPAPLRLVIADGPAFDAALGGQFRAFLSGRAKADEPVTAAWRQSRVGSKLEAQWHALAKDLPWTWTELSRLRPRSLGLALLQVGHLEAVLVVDTPLAQLPFALPKGSPRQHEGVPYALVTRGAGDGVSADRRMGLAWARSGRLLFLATSERALLLALDQAKAGQGLEPSLAGLAFLELDLDALRKDRYFQREFPFPGGPETGAVRAVLRRENGVLVELRQGAGGPPGIAGGAFRFEARAAAAGWEPDGATFWAAFRRGLLEPVPAPDEQPVPALANLPDASPGEPGPYVEDFTKARPAAGTRAGEEGDLGPWKALLARQPIPGWGFLVGRDGVRRLALPWPEALDGEFLECCRATEARRAGAASVADRSGTREILVGPGLPALALRRSGPLLWLAPSARALQDLPEAKADPALVRWARLDLGASRAEAPRWAKVEGPARPETVRPLSDQVLGLLGWLPQVKALAVERRITQDGWEERVVFDPAAPR